MKILFGIVLILFATSPLLAEEELEDTPKAREVAADILLYHTPVRKRFRSYLLANTAKLSEEEQAEFVSSTMANAPWGRLRRIYLETHVRNYTLKELVKLIELAESPEGKQIIYKRAFMARELKRTLEEVIEAILLERREMPPKPPTPPARPPMPPDERV